MNFFIDRPIFASAIALFMVLAGAISALVLPVAQYPPLVPPQVQVSTQYIGGSADVVDGTVTTPLEEQLNGAAGMIYMSSSSTNNGDLVINLTFEVGFDQDIGQVQALTRSNEALSKLHPRYSKSDCHPEVLHQPAAGGHPELAQRHSRWHFSAELRRYSPCRPAARIPGVALVNNFGLSKYAMRIWLDPGKLTNLGLTASDVANAIQEQNQQVAAGKIGQSPAAQRPAVSVSDQHPGPPGTGGAVEDIIVIALENGSVVRIKDVGRVELGAEEYDWDVRQRQAFRVPGDLAAGQCQRAGYQESGARHHATAGKEFPRGHGVVDQVRHHQVYQQFRPRSHRHPDRGGAAGDPGGFIFLQNMRATLIPVIAVPVSLIGTLAFMLAFGFSINILTLLGLVLAVALVVDDAIVVVENVMRKLEEGETDLKQATRDAIAEVRSPIIATTLVLSRYSCRSRLSPA